MRYFTDQQLLDAARERNIGLDDPVLLRQALAHNSAVSKTGNESNERLEFLGDAVLGHIVGAYLFAQHPDYNEGTLTKARSLVVCKDALSAAARRLDLTPLIVLGASEEAMGGRNRDSIVADAYEALVAALTLSRGWESASEFVMRTLEPEIESVAERQDWRDSKTTLQELCEAQGQSLPNYQIVESSGRAHDPTFVAEVSLQSGLTARGTGKSKKEAQKAAAELALHQIANDKHYAKSLGRKSPGRSAAGIQ